jgi:hypothetical protein
MPASALGPQLVAFIESGGGLVVAAAGADGEPRAGRAWGADVVDPGAGRLRLLLGGDDPVLLAHLTEVGRLAVTSADVRTLRSVQVKGQVEALEPATPADRRRADRYCDEFFGAVTELDGNPRALLERLRPAGLVACLLLVTEVYDQTPGPDAGSPLVAHT